MLQEMMDNQMIPLIIFGVSFLAIVGYLGHLEMKARLRTERAEKLSSLRSTVTLIDNNIRAAVERHPVINGTFKIQGENTTKFLDHGSIYSFRDEFFFPINTPIVEKVDTDYNRTSHINKNTFIKVEGTVESYVISAELNDSNLNCRVTFSSSTNTFDEKTWETDN